MTCQRKTIFTCLAGLALFAGTAHASPCWDIPSIGAARISELQTMLMVTSLRCRAIGFDFHNSYERAAETHRAALGAAQLALQAHFGAGGSDGGRRDYDSYLTGVGNFYGTGKTDADTCRAFETLSAELGNATASADLLPMIAMEMVRDPQIAGHHCPPAQSQVVSGR